MAEDYRDLYDGIRRLALGASVGASLAGSVAVARNAFRQVAGGAEPGYHTYESVGVPEYSGGAALYPVHHELGLEALAYVPLAALSAYAALRYYRFER